MKTRLRHSRKLLSAGLIMAGLAFSNTAIAATYDNDPRIKTLVYNDNDVFKVMARPGFQTDIELSPDESIDTLSIGDSIGWQITPANKRIFIKPLQKSGVTNLSVITNRRTYQFELVATNVADNAYVVKFYYPESQSSGTPELDRSRGSLRPISNTSIPEMPGDSKAASVSVPPAPALPGDVKSTPVSMGALNSDLSGNNYHYTLTGPDSLAPNKIYDDGRSTFFEYKNAPLNLPKFAVVSPDGTETPVTARSDAPGRIIIDRTASKFTIRSGTDLICVFNEQMPALPTSGRTY